MTKVPARRKRGGDVEESKSRAAPVARGSTLLVTNLVKLAGLVIALNEMIVREELRASAVAVAAFMMAGATGLDNIVGNLLGGGKK